MYVELPSLLDQFWFSKFSPSSADIFCNLPQKMGRKILKGLLRRSGRYWPLALLMREKFWKIFQNIRPLAIVYFKKLVEKEITPSVLPVHAPAWYVRVWHYNTSCNTLFVRFIRIISWVFKLWLISILPRYINSYEKSCLPIFNMNAINCGPNSFFQSLLLLITDYYSV